MKSRSLPLVLGLAALLPACTARTALAPIGRGHLAPSVSLGGPIVEAFGTRVPIPYLAVGADYGLSDAANASATLHVLPLAYGVVGADAGATWFPVQGDGARPTVGLGARLAAFASLKGDVEDRFMAYPIVSGTAAWQAGRHTLYAGTDVAVPLSRMTYDEEPSAVLASPFVGVRWALGRRLRLSTELKWQGANVASGDAATTYVPVGGHGALTPLFALSW